VKKKNRDRWGNRHSRKDCVCKQQKEGRKRYHISGGDGGKQSLWRVSERGVQKGAERTIQGGRASCAAKLTRPKLKKEIGGKRQG